MPLWLTPDGIRTWLETRGWQYQFVGNAIAATNNSTHDSKWGIVIRDSHFGKLADNVLYNIAGLGLQTEDGGESYNLLAQNFAVRLPGEGDVCIPQPETNPDIDSDIGRDGSGFWSRGSHNWIEGNVAADAKFSGLLGSISEMTRTVTSR